MNDRSDYNKYIASPDWSAKRIERLSLDNGICQVCGAPATQVHHLTYAHFKDEKMDDLVSLCIGCHQMAEKLCKNDPSNVMQLKGGINAGSFMASMCVEAEQIAEEIFNYLLLACGSDFHSVLKWRNDQWKQLKKVINIFCYRRYTVGYMREIRGVIIKNAILNRIKTICMSEIEHHIQKYVQEELYQQEWDYYNELGTWKKVSETLGISSGTCNTLKSKNGKSAGPTLREEILHYCAWDAINGIKPPEGFKSLTTEDYKMLNSITEYFKVKEVNNENQ